MVAVAVGGYQKRWLSTRDLFYLAQQLSGVGQADQGVDDDNFIAGHK